jgi:hypothetical protein
MPLVGGGVRVQAIGADALIVRAAGLCDDPEFVERVVESLAWAVRPRGRLARRDELIRQVAAEFYTGSPRARAVAMLAACQRYETTRWKLDRSKAVCPRDIENTAQGWFWRILKVGPRFPRLRQLQNILPVQ